VLVAKCSTLRRIGYTFRLLGCLEGLSANSENRRCVHLARRSSFITVKTQRAAILLQLSCRLAAYPKRKERVITALARLGLDLASSLTR